MDEYFRNLVVTEDLNGTTIFIRILKDVGSTLYVFRVLPFPKVLKSIPFTDIIWMKDRNFYQGNVYNGAEISINPHRHLKTWWHCHPLTQTKSLLWCIIIVDKYNTIAHKVWMIRFFSDFKKKPQWHTVFKSTASLFNP